MTRQMADDEVLRVLAYARRSVVYKGVDGRQEGELIVSARRVYEDDVPLVSLEAVAALQAERDALIARKRGLVRLNEITRGRAERAESALEALRGQVAEVVAAHTGDNIDGCAMTDEQVSRLAALLAIKERMG